MKMRLLSLLLVLSGCSTVLERTLPPGGETPIPGGVSITFRGDVSLAFRNRVMLRFREKAPERYTLMIKEGDTRVRITLDPLLVDYTPIYCVTPRSFSYFGVRKVTVSRRCSIAVFGRDGGRLLALWEGRVSRPFGLYYMIPATTRKVEEALLLKIGEALESFFR
jgi:hypothetical protein